MSHYRSNLRDIEFNLFEVYRRDEILGREPYRELGADVARTVLAEVERLASTVLAESLADSDRNPPVFDPASHTATLPESVKRSFKAYLDAEWWRLGLPVELGGTPCPPSLQWALTEFLLGANPAVYLYAAGMNFARVTWALGTPRQRELARHMVHRRWAATMVLTEPDAGSDVGAARTRAEPGPDGTWYVTGIKRFITSGEHDLAENIVHFVLARPPGAPPGSKGLSLFLVPKYLFDWDTGELSARNGVYATNVEHKMGLKASTTCELSFGEREPAVGWLLGDVHDGVAQMFRVIEMARMTVGTKAIATLSTGYLNALEFARQRVQGPDLARAADRAAPRVTIVHHPEVRRSLMTQKAYVEGMRALVLYAAVQQDEAELARAADADDGPARRRSDLLLPIVKGYGSERSYEQLAHALQIFGGSGYLQDYPLEQYIRDAKIDTLYEGTTAIQGNDLFFRKIVRDQGEAVRALLGEVRVFADGDGEFTAERQMLATAVDDVTGIIGAMVGYLTSAAGSPGALGPEIYQAGQHTNRLLFALGDLLCGWLLLRQAEVAGAALASGTAGSDADFYRGKVAAARLFALTVLPGLTVQRRLAEQPDTTLVDLPETAF